MSLRHEVTGVYRWQQQGFHNKCLDCQGSSPQLTTSFLSVYASEISSLLAFPNHCCAVLDCLCLFLDTGRKSFPPSGVADTFVSSKERVAQLV
jgi:hypothetical protein